MNLPLWLDLGNFLMKIANITVTKNRFLIKRKLANMTKKEDEKINGLLLKADSVLFGNPKEAILITEEILKLDKRNINALNIKARALGNMLKYEEEIECYNQ